MLRVEESGGAAESDRQSEAKAGALLVFLLVPVNDDDRHAFWLWLRRWRSGVEWDGALHREQMPSGRRHWIDPLSLKIYNFVGASDGSEDGGG